MQVSVILLAAGLGQRMGAAVNKIWLPLAGKPLLQYSLEFFARSPQVSQIIAVAHAGELEQIERLIAELPAELQGKAGLVVEGGSTRLRSVAAALPYISCTADLVAVHDAARPLLGQADWQAVLAAAARPDYLGAILAAPVTDTIKLLPKAVAQAEPGRLLGPIEGSPPRELLWRALTPQVFAIEPFIEAYSRMDKDFTDDAALLAASVRGQVALVSGSADNIKITTPRDLQLAELILAEKAGGDAPCA